MLATSTRLGPYEIVAALGAGGMGEVYRARDTRLGREVAVKVLPEPFANNPDRRARFEREAKAVAQLSHPNILAIHDYGVHESITYAVMDLLEGETLRDRLAKGPLVWREAVDIGAAIAEGLAAAHAKGIVHRDLKPENLFLTADGRVKILDFGLARMTPLPSLGSPSPQSETGAYVPAETDPGRVLGTVGYMSPEQVRSQPADARSDIFSFGCVLFEMVTGRRAFQRETSAETMTAILHDEPPEPTNSGQQVPGEVGRIIRQCLAKTPNQRLQSARDLALGLRATASDPALQRLPAARRFSWPFIGVTALLVGGIGASVYLLTRGNNRPEEGKPAQIKTAQTLAVLPFVNGTPDPNQEYLSDGVAEGIIENLWQMRKKGLRVTSFNVASRYKGQAFDARRIGDELKVQAILTGKVVAQGDSLTMSIELVDVADSTRIWGKKYTRKFTDLQAVQKEITRDVVENLGLALSSEEQQRLVKRSTENPEAFRLYQLGRFYWNKRTVDGVNEGLKQFQQAIEKDPGYALAYAGLADSYTISVFYGYVPPREAAPNAKTAAQKALDLDGTLAQPHATLGMLKYGFDWDWAGAESEFKCAIQLNPADATAHSWYAMFLLDSGRLQEAKVEYGQALEREPASLIINTYAGGVISYYVGQYDQAIEQLGKTLAMDPNFGEAHRALGRVYEKQGKYRDAATEFQKMIRSGGDAVSQADLGHSYALAGDTDKAHKILDELIALRKEKYVPAYCPALIYAGLGQKEKTFEWLHKAYEEKDSHLVNLKMNPIWENLRTDPRFVAILQRMGLADKAAEQDPGIHSVAVLPFENVGGDPKTEFLSNGIPDQIINSLSQVRRKDLKIRSSTSVSRYKRQRPDVLTIGRELNVDVLVTGTLHQQGDNLSISVELVDAREDTHLWSPARPYQGKSGQILDLQDQIARDVAAKLRLQLTGEEEQRLTKRYTDNPEAYLLYREGRYQQGKFTEEGILAAKVYFQRALDKDRNYAVAYVGLADCNILLGALYQGPRKTYEEAREYFLHAQKIDPAAPGLPRWRAPIYMFLDWNWKGAEQVVKNEYLELDPFLAFYLASQGRAPEALEAMKEYGDIGALDPAQRTELAMAYNWAGQYDQAIACAQKALELDPSFPLAYEELGKAYVQQKLPLKAIAELRKALGRGQTHPRIQSMLGFAYAKAGKVEEARKVLKDLNELADQGRFGCALCIARIHAALGETAQAFDWIHKACDERDYAVVFIKVDPTLESLRPDPRFAQILKDMRLPP